MPHFSHMALLIPGFLRVPFRVKIILHSADTFPDHLELTKKKMKE